jgi:serine/threonine protein kinase
MHEVTIANYQLVHHIGSRSLGDLYSAVPAGGDQQLLLQRWPVALDPERLRQDLRWTRRAMAGLRPTSFAAIQDAGNDEEGNLYLVYNAGGAQPVAPLSVAAPGPLPTGEALALTSQLAHLLDQGLQQGLIHKLLLPQTILLDEARSPILLGQDFPTSLVEAILPALPDEELAYLSPEQREGNAIDGRSNIYSLGAILYALLAGSPAAARTQEGWVYTHLRERRPDLPEPVLRLVDTCLQLNGWMRFQTFGALQSAITQALGVALPEEPAAVVTRPLAPVPVRAHAPAAAWRRQSLPVLAAMGALLVVAVLALASGTWLIVQSGTLSQLANSDLPGRDGQQPEPTPTLLTVPDAQAPLLSGSPTSAPGPTPTLAPTRTPQAATDSGSTGAATSADATATLPAIATPTRRGSDILSGNMLPPVPSPTRFFFPQPTPTLAPTATNPPPPAEEAPPPPPPPTEAPLPTPTPPPTPTPDDQPPPTATPPLPGGN